MILHWTDLRHEMLSYKTVDGMIGFYNQTNLI